MVDTDMVMQRYLEFEQGIGARPRIPVYESRTEAAELLRWLEDSGFKWNSNAVPTSPKVVNRAWDVYGDSLWIYLEPKRHMSYGDGTSYGATVDWLADDAPQAPEFMSAIAALYGFEGSDPDDR